MKKVLLFVVGVLFGCSNQKTEISEKKQEGDVVTPVASKPQVISSETTNASTSTSTLVTRNILNKVEVLVPRSFKIMDAEMLSLKYPLKQHTAFQVYTDEEATVNIAFEHTPNKATPEDLPAIKRVFEQQFNKPGIDFKKSEIRKLNGKDFIVIEMITPAVDTEVYNLMFVTSAEGRLLMGTFNCTVDKLKEWKPIAEQILSSVKVKD